MKPCVAVALLVLTTALGACALNPSAPEISRYDLGPQQGAVADAAGFSLRSVEVVAPSWLDSHSIQYRLLYGAAAQRMNYAESRWVAPPAELLESALRRALVSSEQLSVPGGCKLHVVLEEFVQGFDGPATSHAQIELRASLLAPRGEALLARKHFSIARAATSPDARGAVGALAEGVATLTRSMDEWLAGLDRKGAAGLNIPRICRGH